MTRRITGKLTAALLLGLMAVVACHRQDIPVPDDNPQEENPQDDDPQDDNPQEDTPKKDSLKTLIFSPLNNMEEFAVSEGDAVEVMSDALSSAVSLSYDGTAFVSADAVKVEKTGRHSFYVNFPYSASAQRELPADQGRGLDWFSLSAFTCAGGIEADIAEEDKTVELHGELQNIFSLVRFQFCNHGATCADISRVSITSNSGAALSGKYTVSSDTAAPSFVTGEYGSTLALSGLSIEVGKNYGEATGVLLVPPGNYGHDLRVTVTIEGEDYCPSLENMEIVLEAGSSRTLKIDLGEFFPEGIPQSRTLALSDISTLNKGTATVNSHKGATSRSSLMLNRRTFKIVPSSIHGVEGKNKVIYPRMTRTKDGELLIFHHREEGDAGTNYAGNRTLLMKASPDLSTFTSYGIINEPFSEKVSVGSSNTYMASTDCFPLRLRDGNILTTVSRRTVNNYLDNTSYAGLLMRRWDVASGKWARESFLAQDGFNLNWEPFMMQRANGDIHCYFTYVTKIEGWTGVTNNSGTGLIVSHDNGQTWSRAKIISRSQRDYNSGLGLGYYTDQMPSVIELNESHKLVGAFETATTLAGNSDGGFHISLSYATENGEWADLGQASTGPSDKQQALFRGCAPFLVQFPSGETVLSYNLSGSSGFYAKMGDELARNFPKDVTLFPVPATGSLFWGSIYVDNPHALLAAIGGSKDGMYFGSFVLNHDICATASPVTVNGDNSDWSTFDDALFVGSLSQAQATLRCRFSADYLYFLCEVKDPMLSESDEISICICPGGATALNSQSRRIRVSVVGLKDFCTHDGPAWTKSSCSRLRTSCALDGTLDDDSDSDNGWLVELAVPKNLLPEGNNFSINFSLSDSSAGEEWVTALEDVSLWPRLTFKKGSGISIENPGSVNFEF